MQTASDAEFREFIDSIPYGDAYDEFVQSLSGAENVALAQRLGNKQIGNTEFESVGDVFFDQLGSTTRAAGPALAEAAVGALFEPVDWLLTAKEIYNDPKNPLSYAGFLPLLPATTSKLLRAADKGGEFGSIAGKNFAKARTHGHHSIPKEIQKKLPEGVAGHPDVRGRRGLPNVREVDASKHIKAHEKNGISRIETGIGGGKYNLRFQEEIGREKRVRTISRSLPACGLQSSQVFSALSAISAVQI